MLKGLVLVLAIFAALAAGGDLSAKTWTVEYDEPTENEAGTKLGSIPGVSLSKTQIKPVHNGVSMAAIDVPASNASGGGHIKKTITTPDTGACVDDVLQVTVSAWNAVKESSGNPMATGIDAKVTSDPCQKPKSPSNLSVTQNP